MAKTIFVLNGPNLNLLGKRQPEIYGHDTLDDVRAQCKAAGAPHGIEIELKQSNHEGQIIDWIHEARDRALGGYRHRHRAHSRTEGGGKEAPVARLHQ